jgi:hypothetical protein
LDGRAVVVVAYQVRALAAYVVHQDLNKQHEYFNVE